MSKSPKLKPLPRPLFSCGIFRNCTQSVLSPTAPPSSSSLLPPPPPSDQLPPPPSSTSSSSSTSPSFTQWRFPLHHPQPNESTTPPPPGGSGGDVFGAAEAQFRGGAALGALRVLEKAMADGNNGGGGSVLCPEAVMAGVVAALRESKSARPAAKVLLALLLVESNRHVAVQSGAVPAAIEAVVAAASGSTSTSTAERSLAALELMCTINEGSSAVRDHALAVPAMSGAVQGMQGRGRECAIGVLSAIYSSEQAKEAPEEAARAVMVAMQGECSVRGRRKGAALLRAMHDCGRLDLDLNFD